MRKYEKYKDSGVEWIGEVPEHWKICLFKRIITLNNGGDYKNIIANENGYPVIGSGGQFAQASKYIYDGEAILLGRKGTIDNPLYIKGKFWVVDTMFYGIPKKNTCAKFLYYQALTIPFERYSTSTALPSMTQTDLNNNPISIPPLPEQKSIASYLDSKVGEIDNMIEKTEKKIELYEELKKSIITHAVTKGLNPNVKMKDSGVDWIGKIPENWEYLPLKRYGEMNKGITFTKSDLVDIGNPVISYGQIHSKLNNGIHVSSNLIRYIPDKFIINENKAKVHFGDFIFADTSEDLEGCGNCIYIDSDISLYAGYHSIILRTNGKDSKYFAYLFKTDIWRNQIRSMVSGVKVYSITQSILSFCSIIVPPLPEQESIVSYLDSKTSAIDSQISIAHKRIDLLKELKTSLITNVVTGKIKVC